MMLGWLIESKQTRGVTMLLASAILQVSTCDLQHPTREQLSEVPFSFKCIFQDDITSCELLQFQHCMTVPRSSAAAPPAPS